MVLGGISWVHGKEAGYSSGSVYIYICGIYYLNIWFQFLCLGIMLPPKQVYCNIQRNLLRIQAWTASFSAFLCPPILLNINPVPRNTKPISPEFTDWSILEPYWSRVEGNYPPFVLEEMVFWWYQPLRSVPQILTHHDFQQFFLIDSLLYDIFIPGILLQGLPPFSQLNKKTWMIFIGLQQTRICLPWDSPSRQQCLHEKGGGSTSRPMKKPVEMAPVPAHLGSVFFVFFLWLEIKDGWWVKRTTLVRDQWMVPPSDNPYRFRDSWDFI